MHFTGSHRARVFLARPLLAGSALLAAGAVAALLAPGRPAQAARPEAPRPLAFEENRGQTDPRVRFMARGSGYTTFLTETETVFTLRPRGAKARPAALRMRLSGAARPRRMRGEAPLPGRVNYLRGRQPEKWITDVPTYARVRAEAVYPGVDMAYYGRGQALEYDFLVAPGADPSRIRWKYAGASGMSVDASGSLVLRTPAGELRQAPPEAYQLRAGRRVPVPCGYRVDAPVPGRPAEVALALGRYDRGRPLVIDPVLWYSTYLGGNRGTASNPASGEDEAQDLVQRGGEVYVVGTTESPNFPTTAGALDRTFRDAFGNSDVFVTRYGATTNNTQTPAILYSTFIGGDRADTGNSIAIDANGTVSITGSTESQGTFPLTPGAFDVGFNGGASDAFVARLNANGTALLYSTFFGGSKADVGNGIAVSASGGAIFVTGSTDSTDFPLARAFQTVLGGTGSVLGAASDAFVARFNPTASGAASLIYSSYLGGQAADPQAVDVGADVGTGIAVDAFGNVVVCGFTDSSNFPTRNGILPDQGGRDAFVTRISTTPAIVFSTYLGGEAADEAEDVALDLLRSPFTLTPGGIASIYVTGGTESSQFPVQGQVTSTQVLQPFQSNRANVEDAFVTRMSGAGAILWSTYLGGNGRDRGNSIAVGIPARVLSGPPSVYVAGQTTATNFPTRNPITGTGDDGGQDAFLTQLNSTGSGLVFSTYLGGDQSDTAQGVALQPLLSLVNVFLAGTTRSEDFPVRNAPQSAYGGGPDDGWTAKIGSLDQPPVVECAVRRPLLWPPNGRLRNVGLQVRVRDDRDLSPSLRVFVVSDEDDLEPGTPERGPDAARLLPGTLRLRAERSRRGDGRIYLILVQATDAQGNVGYAVCPVGVPLSRGRADLNALNRQARAAAEAFLATGQEPEGFHVVGDERPE